MYSAHKKYRNNSVHHTTSSKTNHNHNKQIKSITETTQSNNKHKRTQKIQSQIVKSSKKETKHTNKKNVNLFKQQPINQISNIQFNNNNPHLLTVADLQSDRSSHKLQSKNSPMNTYKQQSTIKMQDASVQAQKFKITLPVQLQKNLDQTIQKLKSKQESIDILSRTIQTRLVQPNKSKLTGRLDVYEVQINFYIEKITQLQKQLHEKNKIIGSLTQKNIEFNTVVKNNRRLIGENHRLKQQRQLLQRQNQALKNLLIKRTQKSYGY